MNKMFFIALVSAFSVSGCTTFSAPAKQESLDAATGHWISYDATRRGTIVVPAGANVKTCSEPSPDAALNLVSKLDGSLKKDGVGEAKGTAEFDASVVKLAERTQMVMFLRESLFRLCEQSINQNFTKDEVLSAYNNTIATAKAIVEADKAKADADKANAQAAAANAFKALSADQLRAIQ